MVSKEDLTERLAALQKAERDAFANFNAVLGARMECEYWLDRLDKEVEPEEPTEE